MACACHGKQGAVVNRKVPPDDQCTTCATKHINMAFTAWGEFTYEDDSRLWAAGHIRLAVEHLKIDHRDLALELRDLAVLIEENRDENRTDVRDKLRDALYKARELMLKDHRELDSRKVNLKLFNAGGNVVDTVAALPDPLELHNYGAGAVRRAELNATEIEYVFRTWPHVSDRAAASGALWNLTKAYPEIGWKWAADNDALLDWHENDPAMKMADKVKNITISYDNTDFAGDKGNLVEGYTKFLEKTIGKPIPMATRVPYVPHTKIYPGLPPEYYVLVAGYEDQCQAKAWPWWRELCDMLNAAGKHVVRIGNSKYNQHSLDMPNAIDLYNKTSEKDLLAVLEYAACVIGPPTGAVHIASGYGVRSVCISGAREPARLLDYPNCIHVASYNCYYDANYGCISFDITKRNRNPCQDIEEYPCGWSCAACMGACTPEAVFAAAMNTTPPEGWSVINLNGMRVYEPSDIAAKHSIEMGKSKVSFRIEKPTAELKDSGSDEKVDVIVPLGNGSVDKKDEELKILLRSIDKNLRNVGRIFLATKYCPEWINRNTVNVEDIDDVGCKDAALINKVSTILEKYDITGRFIFAADDNVIMQSMNAPDLINLTSSWGLQSMLHPNGSVWMHRLMKTLRYFRDKGALWPYKYSFETHTPQIFDASKLREALKTVDYAGNCFTITTLFRGLVDDIKELYDAEELKWTFYGTPHAETLGKLNERWFVGYNDEGFTGGLRDKLFELFPDKAKYEL